MKTPISSSHPAACFVVAIFTVLLMTPLLTAKAQDKSNIYKEFDISLGDAIGNNSKQKKIKKKFIKQFQPYSGYTKACGLSLKNGDKVIFYQTNVDWNFNKEKVVHLWDIAFKLAENMNYTKFMQSGLYHGKSGRPRITYYMYVSVMVDDESCNAMLAFSEHNGKVLYKLFISEEFNDEKWRENSENILKNAYVMSTSERSEKM